MFSIIKKARQALGSSSTFISHEERRQLKAFFLNHPKDIAEKKHPLLAWAYHVHAQMLSFYQDALDTPTFCEATQMRSWQKANQIALCVLEDRPIHLPLEAKTIQLQEAFDLREDVRSMDRELEKSHPQLAILAYQHYHAWSILYFDHFPLSGINQELLLEVDILAEQASMIAHPYFSPDECQALRLQIANACLKQSSWGMPLWSPDELLQHVKSKVASQSFRYSLTQSATLSKIAQNQRHARQYLAQEHPQEQGPLPRERSDAIKKINELQTVFGSNAMYARRAPESLYLV